ncbi:DEAD/DEAH box helicase [Ornithinimicrobium avium]|uniref:DEAD/DEAH box helicase n=1 Tax=Ornithinimicrobium avium TaxID=2283195 RepID=UPI001D17DB7B|nr:DEAD/DEAH box helicase [Ornithinimicrobium avium]
MTSASFADLGVPTILTDVLAERGITVPTPIQAATLPDSLPGRDVLGRGRTGSGKTYAFLLPMVDRLMADAQAARRRGRKPRALILAPTRELVRQIDEALQPLAAAAGLSSVTIFGGVGQNPQVRALQAGVDVLVACPGRLEDLIGQGFADLGQVQVSILDEADHMSDLGFLPAVKRLLDRTPSGGQRMLFSATLDKAVDVVAKRYLVRPVTHHADSEQSPVDSMAHHVLHIDGADRLPVLTDLGAAPGRTVMFTRTKHGAKKLAKQLNAAGVPSVDLHGNLSQNARVRNLEAFHSGKASTLVATDIAARGIHVDDVALVVHADPPVEHKAYLHRSGRTARAGASGTVVTLMTDDQVRDVRSLTRAAGIRPTITRATPAHPVLTELAPGERTLVPGGLVVESGAANGNGHGGGGRGRSGGNAHARTGGGGRGRAGGGGGRAGGGGGRSGGGRNAGGRTGAGRSRTTQGASSGGSVVAFSSSSRSGSRSR